MSKFTRLSSCCDSKRRSFLKGNHVALTRRHKNSPNSILPMPRLAASTSWFIILTKPLNDEMLLSLCPEKLWKIDESFAHKKLIFDLRLFIFLLVLSLLCKSVLIRLNSLCEKIKLNSLIHILYSLNEKQFNLMWKYFSVQTYEWEDFTWRCSKEELCYFHKNLIQFRESLLLNSFEQKKEAFLRNLFSFEKIWFIARRLKDVRWPFIFR